MSSNIKVQRICNHCNNEFTAKTTQTLYCSKKCNQGAYKAAKRNEKILTSNEEVRKVKERSLDILKAKEFLTVRDASRLLNSSVRTIYRMIEKGTLKAVNIAERKTLIKRSDIDKLFS